MLATRIVPVMLQRGSTLVKGTSFNSWRSVGHSLQAVRIYNARGVDELIYLDIAATPEGRGPDFETVRKLTDECFMPITVGGGVRSVDDVRELLSAGADKVAICTAALEIPGLISDASDQFGSQAIVASVDVREPGYPCARCGTIRWELFGAVTWARALANAGAGEILLTSIDRDGTLQGYDLDLISAVSKAVNIPVIAAGGAGTYEHLYEGIKAGASAVAAGAMWTFTDATPKGAAHYLAKKGVEVRL